MEQVYFQNNEPTIFDAIYETNLFHFPGVCEFELYLRSGIRFNLYLQVSKYKHFNRIIYVEAIWKTVILLVLQESYSL